MSTPTSQPSAATPPADATQWFTQEVQPHDAQLKSYLRGSFPAVRDVDDVVQESYLRVWKARARHPIQHAKAFLYQAARNIALNVLRKNCNAPFTALRDFEQARVIEEKPDARETLLIQERIDLLADALMSLPPRCREITFLHKIEGLPQRAIAEKLNLSERTVETQVRIGVERCLRYLEKRGVNSREAHEA